MVVPLWLLKQSNEEQMTKLYELLRKLPACIHWLLEQVLFPSFMQHQLLKLSASGQELGGSMLFGRRIGFSGTPSDLLPLDLGSCGYEKGSDGKMLHVLTDPEVVMRTQAIAAGWTVKSLLRHVANAEPKLNALIDTGALITGLRNKSVAHYLLAHGLGRWCEGVVFLDESDEKMILVKATGRVLKLSQCGVSVEKRFAFYDQIHTTGMDIKHALNARAALTLGKDMVFRDLAQGAFRMRGIGEGQTVTLLVIPEVQQLMQRQLAKAGHRPLPPSPRQGVLQRAFQCPLHLCLRSRQPPAHTARHRGMARRQLDAHRACAVRPALLPEPGQPVAAERVWRAARWPSAVPRARQRRGDGLRARRAGRGLPLQPRGNDLARDCSGSCSPSTL